MKVGTESIGSELWGFFYYPTMDLVASVSTVLHYLYRSVTLSFTLSFTSSLYYLLHYLFKSTTLYFTLYFTEVFHYRWENGRQLSLLSNYRKE